MQPLIAVAAWKLGRAVRLVYERPESMQSSTKRHPATMQASAACDADGRLVAFDFAGDFNTGAYSSWGPTVANRVPIHASGPYRIANVRALTRAVLTHNSVAGAFRGFGVPQSTLLGELLIDELAERTGCDALEFRHRNALVAGDTTPTGQTLAASVGLRACLDALRPAWAAANAPRGHSTTARRHPERSEDLIATPGSFAPLRMTAARRGAGIACMWYGIGNTVIANPSTMRGALRWNVGRGAHLFLYNGAQEIGQGTATIMPQMFADAVGLRAGVRRAGDGRHRPDCRRRQVVGVAPDLRLRQRRQGRGRRPAPAADRAARLRRSRPMPTSRSPSTAIAWSAAAAAKSARSTCAP